MVIMKTRLVIVGRMKTVKMTERVKPVGRLPVEMTTATMTTVVTAMTIKLPKLRGFPGGQCREENTKRKETYVNQSPRPAAALTAWILRQGILPQFSWAQEQLEAGC